MVSQQPVHDLQSLASVIGGLKAKTIKAVSHGLSLLTACCFSMVGILGF